MSIFEYEEFKRIAVEILKKQTGVN